VGGEGLWSKAQKDAVHHLLWYARTFDERDYERYREAIAVPLGDRKAREALDRPQPDFAAARRGLIEGRNHPDDVDAMASLFVRFRHVSYVDKAIGIWAEADGEIVKLQDAAQRLRAAKGQPAAVAGLLEEINRINGVVGPLEDEFSFTLGAATRWMRDALFLVLMASAGVLVGAAALRTRALLRQADRAEAARRESDERLLLVANGVPALIAYVDREQRFRFSNRTYEEWYGFPHERMQDRSMREVFGEATYEARVRSKVERVLAGERIEFEYSLDEDENSRFLQVTYAPHLSMAGDVLGFYVLASDITALKLAEQHERNAARELAKVA
jgi:PAS domain S-box-containing protein